MGQIVSMAAKPKRCNKNQLSQLGVLAAGLYVLVSSDNSMDAAGQGNFDCYIVGDGTTAATALELKSIDGFAELEGEVTDIKSAIDYDQNSIQISVQYTGKYINTNGGLANSANFNVSAPIRLLKGEKIVASLAAYSNQSAISRTNEAGTEFTSLVLGKGVTLSLIEYEYIAAEDCYVALCCYVGNFPSSVSVYNSGVISDIKKDVYFLDSLLKTVPVYNIAAVSDYVPGKYVNSSGNISTLSGDLSVAVEKIVGVKTLHYKGRLSANTYIGLYNSPDMSSETLVSILLGSASTTDYDQNIIIPIKGEFWLGISGVSVSTLNPRMSVVDYYDTVDLSYFEIEKKVNNENHIYVGANRKIKTLLAAFEAVGDGTQYEKNIIHLDAESFNVFDGVELSGKDTTYRGLDVPNHTYIMGQGVDKTIIIGSIPTGYSNLNYNNISALNMEFVGGCKNLTIHAHNIRYCIHTDCMLSNDQERKSEINHENVKFYHDGLDDGVVATAMAYGLGCRSNSHTVFENCEFINNSGGRVTFNLHNNQAALLPSLVEFHNCVFNNLSYSDAGVLSIMSEGTGNSDKVVLNGCNFNGGISMKRLSGVNVFDQDVVGGGNGNCRVTIAGGVGIEKISIDGFENLYSIATLSPGDAVSLLTFNRAEKATNKNLIYGVALTSATSGQKVKVQTQGLIQASIVGIGGTDGDLVSLVNGKLTISSADPVGVVICGGNFIKLF